MEGETEARLIGEIVEEAIAALGADKAMMPTAIVEIAPARIGRRQGRSARPVEHGGHAEAPRNSASVCEHIARPQAAQRGILSR